MKKDSKPAWFELAPKADTIEPELQNALDAASAEGAEAPAPATDSTPVGVALAETAKDLASTSFH
ncbi:hypothetical protein G3A43_08225 [Paraburkholderia aspalathi]|nr:hypothetical protein [Paraburkholderia aspalathi]MBK3780242.1 hypothetical protein [Paraburkholderia aspalathi]